MRVRFLTVVLLLAISGTVEAQRDPSRLVVKGLVFTRGYSDRPLAHARVIVQGSGGRSQHVHTDSLGVFRTEVDQRARPLEFRISAIGYVPRVVRLIDTMSVDSIDFGSIELNVVLRDHISPAIIYPKMTTAGIGATMGAGVEFVGNRPNLAFVGIGVGAVGVGGRVVTTMRRFNERFPAWSYVGGEFVYAPWKWGPFQAGGGAGASLGMRRWMNEATIFVDVGAGYLWLQDGTWWGRRSIPTLRVQMGF